MFNNVNQFKSQNIYWRDKYYHYAIHITDGGAKYLYQIDCKGELTDEKVKGYHYGIRLDGSDIDLFVENIKKIK